MSRAFIAAQIIGALFFIIGCYIIGDWHIALGIFIIMFGDNIQKSVKPRDKGQPDTKDKNWE